MWKFLIVCSSILSSILVSPGFVPMYLCILVFYDKTFLGETLHTFTHPRLTVQIENPSWWVLLGLFTGIWVRDYLQEQKWLRQLYHQSAHSSMGYTQLTKLGTWSSRHCLQAAQQVTEWPFQMTSSRQANCFLLFLGSFTDLRVFVATLLGRGPS